MILSGYLSDNVKMTKVSDGVTAATSAVVSAPVDMQNWEGVLFFTSFGTAAAGNILKGQQSDDISGSPDNYSDLAGSAVTSGTSDEDVFLDVTRPGKRYVQVSVARGTSSTLGDIWALQYGPRSQPQDNVLAGTIVGKQLHTPAEGAA